MDSRMKNRIALQRGSFAIFATKVGLRTVNMVLKDRNIILVFWILLSAVWSSLSVIAFADTDEEPLYLYRGVRPMGLSNAFEAIADDENAFHYNPAGLAQRNGLFYLLPIRPKITFDLVSELQEIQDLINTIGPITRSQNPLEDATLRDEREILVERLETALEEDLGAILDLPSMGLAFPLRVSGYKIVLGGTIYTQSVASLRIERRGLLWSDAIIEMLDNAIIYRVSFQWAVAGAGAIEIPVGLSPILDKAYVGMALRRINRWLFTNEEMPLTVVDAFNYKGPDGIEGTSDDFINRYFSYDENDSFLDIARKNFKKQTGYGADLGVIASPFDGLKVALVMRNLVSTVNIEDEEESKSFPRNVVLSVAAKPLKILEMQPSILDLTVAANLDRLNGDERFTKFSIGKNRERIHLGIEAILWPNNKFSLSGRMGNNQGFLTLGAALRIGPLHLEFAKYGDLQADWYVASINLLF